MFTLVLCLIGFLNTFLIVYFNKRNIFLALFYFVTSLHGLTFYFVYVSNDIELAALSFVHALPFLNLSGPFLWFYVRGSILNNNNFEKRDWIHLILFLFSVVTILPYFLQPWATKILIATRLQNFDLSSISNINFPFFSFLTLFKLRTLYFFGYFSYSVYYLVKSNSNSKVLVEPWKLKWFKWVFSMIFISAITLFATFYFLIFFSFSGEAVKIGSLIIVISGSTIFLSTFFFPQVLYGNLIKNEPVVYKPIELSDSSIIAFQEKLNQYLLAKPFINDDFSKSKLMSDLLISDRFFTAYFNVYLNSNFNLWKSNLRIDYSSDLIKSGYLKDKTILGLANTVGFQSRSNFTEAFKMRFGSSPNEYSKNFFS